MAQKRKAKEAFGKTQGQLSAFAAAKLARQSAQVNQTNTGAEPLSENLATIVATEPYDGHHSRASTPDAVDTGHIAVTRPLPERPPTRLSSWIPSTTNVLQDDDECFDLLAKTDETITFVGQYDVEVLSGVATVYGWVIRQTSGPQRIHAPSIHALPSLHARQDNTRIRITSTEPGVQKLEKLSPLFRNIWSAPTRGRSFTLIGTLEDDSLQRSLNSICINRETEIVLRTLSAKASVETNPLCVMAIGAKSSGKSTFNRILCNHLLSWAGAAKVFYLDLDPGQPEFGPPGQMSLVDVSAPILGPPLAHPASTASPQYKLIRSHTIASTTFKEDPDLYLAAAADLVQYVPKGTSLIVNSSGWVTGTGAAVLLKLVNTLRLTDLVLLDPVDRRLSETLQFSQSNGPTLHRTPRQAPCPAVRTPAEMRAMQTMSYMHHRTDPQDGVIRWSGKALCDCRPWIVNYSGSKSGINAVTSYGQSPLADHLSEVLNGSIVAIVAVDDDGENAFLPESDQAQFHAEGLGSCVMHTSEGLPYLASTPQATCSAMNPAASHCVGLALIHCIDTEQQTFHLHTPISSTDVARLSTKKVVLVRGNFDLPEWAYLEDIYKQGEAAKASLSARERPWVTRREMVGVEGAVWRLRHPPMASSVTISR